MGDVWELAHGLDPNDPNDAGGDADTDGLTNAEEYARTTDPHDADSDGDGIADGLEVSTYSTDPAVADSDGDGLVDGDEIALGTNPLSADHDGDGMSDGWEYVNGLDPTDPLDAGDDADGDGCSNLSEYTRGTDPNDAGSLPSKSDTAVSCAASVPAVSGMPACILLACVAVAFVRRQERVTVQHRQH